MQIFVHKIVICLRNKDEILKFETESEEKNEIILRLLLTKHNA